MSKLIYGKCGVLRDLYIYDPREHDLRHRRDDGTAGPFVPPAAIDVREQDLLLVGDQYFPKFILINRLCSEIRDNTSSEEFAYDPGDEPPSQERVRELFDYDAIKGTLIHRKNRTGVKAGTIAGSKPRDPRKALKIKVDGFRTTVQRIIYIWVYGISPPGRILNKDGDKTYNVIENLYVERRYTPPTPQTHYEENSFGVRSVFRNLRIRKWCSMLPLDVDICHIGYHNTFIDAVKDVVQAGLRHDRVWCIEVDEAREYLKKHEPEYLKSLGL
jgi:hypothetical protein